ncbi:MAG: tRNA pseudouridine(38-40) synthase TruA [Chthoniobacterales bacterium]
MRIKLTIAYDGATFAGWQSQAGGNTVQDEIEAALARIAQTPLRLHGSGRTDSGVHALGQVAHFDAPEKSNMSPSDWQRALNGSLPRTVRILRAARAAKKFHARFDATGKIYRYDIWTGDVLPPHLFRRAWHMSRDLDLAALHATLHLFEGSHDFRAFSANRGTPASDTVRTIHSIRVTGSRSSLHLTFEGDGFLYKMVRMLVGAAIRVATGREDQSTIRRMLAGEGRWTDVAPADGLYLVRVRY